MQLKEYIEDIASTTSIDLYSLINKGQCVKIKYIKNNQVKPKKAKHLKIQYSLN